MVGIGKYIWWFPLIGGITTLISFSTPAAYFFYDYPTYSTQFYRWMLDFYVSLVFFENGTQTINTGINTSPTGYISWICSLLIIISSIIIILNANKYRKGIIVPKNNWLIFSLIITTLTLSWMIMKEISTINSYSHSFWGLLSPGFGIIGPFLGAGLILVGYLFLKIRLP